MKEVFYRSTHTLLRRELRRSAPFSERILWEYLRKKRLCGYKFRRQAGIGRYVADFYCFEAKLVVEVDGLSHETTAARQYDRIRDGFMNDLGLSVQRFQVQDLTQRVEYVIAQIHSHLPPHPCPFP